MYHIRINDTNFKIKNSWQDLKINDAVKLQKLIDEMPDKLKKYYGLLLSDNKDAEANKLSNEITPEEEYKIFPSFYGRVILLLSDITPEILEFIDWQSRKYLYNSYCIKLVFGLLYYPTDYLSHGIEFFEFENEKYYLPKTEKVLNKIKPMANVETIRFTESADLMKFSKEVEGGKYEYAANIISILCLQEGETYNESISLKRAERFIELPMTIFFEVFFCLQQLRIILHQHTAISFLEGELKQQKQV